MEQAFFVFVKMKFNLLRADIKPVIDYILLFSIDREYTSTLFKLIFSYWHKILIEILVSAHFVYYTSLLLLLYHKRIYPQKVLSHRPVTVGSEMGPPGLLALAISHRAWGLPSQASWPWNGYRPPVPVLRGPGDR